MIRFRIGAAALAIAILGGCAVNPVTRRPELAMVSQSTELELGVEQARTIEREMGLLGESELVAYVRGVGARVAASSPRRDVPYAFHVVDAPEPNAFAVPGHVYVTRGLLVLVNDEDELAGVLAHEVGHIAARHAVQRISRALPAGILTGVVSGVTGLASPMLGSLFAAGGSLATEALLAPYSRDQEREADRVGQEIAARAGYDPSALPRALATLERCDALGAEPKRRPSFLDSHPSTPERARTTAAYARELARVPASVAATPPERFLARLDGLVVGPSAAQGVFEQTTFLQPDLGFHVRFPSDWKTVNGPDHVAGAAPGGDVVVMTTIAAEGDDPMNGVRAFEKSIRQPLTARVERTTIGGLPAEHVGASAASDGDRVAIELFWVALGGRVFQLTGVASVRAERAARATIAAVADTFGPLTVVERDGIRERRLRLVVVRPGESPTSLARRTQSPWKPEMIAVANGLEPGAPLPAGHTVKIAKSEPYAALTTAGTPASP
jgi:predicted Zn-dependent protease